MCNFLGTVADSLGFVPDLLLSLVNFFPGIAVFRLVMVAFLVCVLLSLEQIAEIEFNAQDG